MSGQTMQLAASMPKIKKVWEKAGASLSACEFLIIRLVVHPSEYTGAEGQAFPVNSKAGVPLRFPSLTAALRYNAAALADAGYSRSKSPGQGIMCEAGMWGVWRLSGTIKDGKPYLEPGGKDTIFQTVLPVPKEVAEMEDAPAAGKPAQAKKKPSAAPTEASPAPKPAQAKKGRASKSQASSAEVKASEPASPEGWTEVPGGALPEGIQMEGDKFRVGNLLLPSLELAQQALAAGK
jgi:hypothetical protein